MASLVSLVSLGVEGIFGFLLNPPDVFHGHTVPAGSAFTVWTLPAKYLKSEGFETKRAVKQLPGDGIK